MNSRLDELHAALLSARLPWLEGFNGRRRRIAGTYRRDLKEGRFRLLAPPVEAENHVHHLFVILCERRGELMAHLKAEGVESQIHYPVPVHRQEPCLSLARDPEGLAHAELHAERCVSIPCHPQLGDADVESVVRALNAF